MKAVDGFLNSITMYRLMIYILLTDLALSVILAFLGILPYTGWSIAISTGVLYVSCEISNRVLSKIFNAMPNNESATITGLILALVLAPASNGREYLFLMIAGLIAMTSKYVLSTNKKHIFNPAVVALLVLDLTGVGSAVWWIGSESLIVITLITGLLVVRKIRRFRLFISFFVSSIISITIFALVNGNNPIDIYATMITSWPILFFGTIMLTEPSTTPPGKTKQIIYGSLVGLLFGSSFRIGPFFSTPELALAIGNLYAYCVSLKYKLILKLKDKVKLAPDIYEFIFEPDRKLHFEAGQYLEWTLPHRDSDNRGNRRYFTISSSPSDKNIRFTFRYDDQRPSSFKKTLMETKEGGRIGAGQLSGDFVLPENKTKKIAFLAGGVGITPFVSMIREMIYKKEKRDINLVYVNKTQDDIIFEDMFKNVKKLGIKTDYVLSDLENIHKKWTGETGHLDTELLKKLIPDFNDRIFYISGPNSLVDSLKDTLKKLGIGSSLIITDYFPGY